MEKRQYCRMFVSLPIEYQIQLQDPDGCLTGRAVLKNFSQGGLYFECETLPQLKKGKIGEFTFAFQGKNSIITLPIKTQAVVKRIEPRVAGTSNFGVAVQFCSAPPVD